MKANVTRFPGRLFAVIALGAVALQALFTIIAMSVFPTLEKAGSFGDLFGAVNTLFSGLAFAGIVIAIVLQKDELTSQREELALSRDELRGQREQLALQNSQLQQQTFETSFYAMLRYQREETHQLRIRIVGREHVGLGAFQMAFNELKGRMAMRVVTSQPPDPSPELRIAEDACSSVCLTDDSDFGPYFRRLALLFSYVDAASTSNHPFYYGLIRSGLSGTEQGVLFAYGLTTAGISIKQLIETHGLLHGFWLPPHYEAYKRHYAPSAFDAV